MAERFKVIVSNKAREDIKGIIHYLMTTYSHASAVSTVQAINKKIDGLSTFPESNQIFHRRGGELNILY
ncbi:MAG: plasmid stabilization system protein ParE [Neolewinella sp.]|jgi:plasmid stabilization system protein ParE